MMGTLSRIRRPGTPRSDAAKPGALRLAARGSDAPTIGVAPRATAVERAGFTLIELLISLVILTVGVLALASVTGFLILQVRVADIRTEQAMAVQQAVEQVRAEIFVDIADRAEADALQIGSYTVWWRVANSSSTKKDLVFYSRGPHFVPGEGFSITEADSFDITLVRLN